MSLSSIRLSRARDFALTVLGAGFFALALLFVAGRLWFRALLVAALDMSEPLIPAAICLVVVVVLGILHAFFPPPLSGPDDGRIRARSEGSN